MANVRTECKSRPMSGLPQSLSLLVMSDHSNGFCYRINWSVSMPPFATESTDLAKMRGVGHKSGNADRAIPKGAPGE